MKELKDDKNLKSEINEDLKRLKNSVINSETAINEYQKQIDDYRNQCSNLKDQLSQLKEVN